MLGNWPGLSEPIATIEEEDDMTTPARGFGSTRASFAMTFSVLLLIGACWSEAVGLSVENAQKERGNAKQDPSPGKLLLDGKSLAGWKSAEFGGEGDVFVKEGAIVMEQGSDMTGITYTRGDFPTTDYEVTLEGKRLLGNDFFCTTTFPVGDSHCSLVVGGWAGTVVGLSSINSRDASENETNSLQAFKRDQWYRVRIRVTKERIEAWIDNQKVVDLATKGKKISIRPECELCKPFGVATWRTTGAVRDIRVRTLTATGYLKHGNDETSPPS